MSSPQPTAIDPVCANRFDGDAIAYVTVARLGLEGWGETQAPGFLMRGRD